MGEWEQWAEEVRAPRVRTKNRALPAGFQWHDGNVWRTVSPQDWGRPRQAQPKAMVEVVTQKQLVAGKGRVGPLEADLCDWHKIRDEKIVLWRTVKR